MTHETTKEKYQQEEPEHEDSVPAPPDGGYGWVIVFASFVCNMMVDGTAYCFGILLPKLIVEYESSQAKVAWVGSILAGTMLCAGPFVSAVANKYGCRVSCIAGAIITAVSFALSIFSPSIEVLMFVFGVGGGLGFGFIYVPAVVCVGYYFESKRSLATGISVCGSGVGTIVFAPLVGFLVNNYNWKVTNLVLAALAGITCTIFGCLMKPIEYKKPEPEKTVTMVYQNGTAAITDDMKKSYTSLGDLTASRQSLASKKSQVLAPLSRQDVLYGGSLRNLKEFQSQKSLHDFRQSMVSIPKHKSQYGRGALSGICRILNDLFDFSLMSDPVFLVIAFSNAFAFTALYVPFSFMLKVTGSDGIPQKDAELLISFIGITNTIGRVVIGFIADFPKINTLLLNNICMVVMTLAIGSVGFCHQYIAYSAAALIYGSAMAGFISLTSILLVEFLGLEKLTSAFGLMILFRGAGAIIGPPLHGQIIEAYSYCPAFLVASAFFALATILSFLIPCVQGLGRKTIKDEALTPVNIRVDEAV